MGADESREVAREIIDTMPSVMQTLVAEMRRVDEPMRMPHFRAMMAIAHGGPCTLTGLAEKQLVSAPTMSSTVTALVEHGWVERVTDEQDRRRAEVHLTAEGSAAVRRMRHHVEGLLEERLATMSAEDLAQLRAGLAALRRAFGAHPSTAQGEAR